MHNAIGLSEELAEIRNAVDGARFLADELASGGLEDRKRELQAPLSPSRPSWRWWNYGCIKSSACCGGRKTRCCCGRRTTMCSPSKPRMQVL